MQKYERFGECLKRILKETDMSASEVAKLVGFRSRNSMFRILGDEAGEDVKLRFLEALHHALGEVWPETYWLALQEALRMERLGRARYEAYQALGDVLSAKEETVPFMVREHVTRDQVQTMPLGKLLAEAAASHRTELVITGCCDTALSRLIAEVCSAAGSRGSLTVRHYIDIAEECVTQNILGILPLISKPWYNARLVDEDSCPPEMMAIYRLHCIRIQRWDAEGRPSWTICVRYDRENFTLQEWQEGLCQAVVVVDRWRFNLELLKPLVKPDDAIGVYIAYTNQYRLLEENCTIMSIKPDVHFNCIPTQLLEQAVLEGFDNAGIAAGPELHSLMDALADVHDRRFDNIYHKHKPTHLVYSLPEMERFVRTGVMSDQLFVQRAYTVEERRRVIRILLDAMRENPWFNIHLLREGAPEIRYEITLFDGKGVLLMDAYTGYELHKDHSEALITLPAFMESFRAFFMDELLPHLVRSKAETMRILENLLVMDVQE